VTGGAKVLISTALIVAYVLAVPWLGFFTATFVYLIAHMTMLGIRPLWKPPAVTVGVLAVLYALFEFLLRVDLPGGVLF
jgi:hypothetical protein